MTDLENLWDEMPTGPAPVDAILGAGRSRMARRRKLRRSLVGVGASTALLTAFAAGSLVGGGPGTGVVSSQGGPSPVAFQADLKPAKSCAALLTSYRERGLAMVTAWGWAGAWLDGYSAGDVTALRAERATDERLSQKSSPTGTNVQESAVDEPDTVKTNGKLVVRLRGDDLLTYDTSGPVAARISAIHLPSLEDGEIMFAGTTVVVIGANSASPRDNSTGGRQGSRVITISLATPTAPKIESTVTYESRIVSARQHGSTVRLVLSAGLPDLNFVDADNADATQHEALVANRRAVRSSTLTDWLPTYDAGQGPRPLLDCSDVAVPPDALGLDTVSVVGFDAATPTKPHAIGLAGTAGIAYESKDHLYLADSWAALGRFGSRTRTIDGRTDQTTHLYDFKLNGVDAVHVASGEVVGSIADRWSLDEAGGDLRAAVGRSSETGTSTSVVTFRRSGDQLTEIGRLDGLGRGEDLKGVRWFDDLGILVTYRQVDPLYTVDLADPTHPTLIGKLKIPGYSDYLHPLGNNQLLGIGYIDGRAAGAQVALFDISDLAHVTQTDVTQYPGAQAVATWEPRAFTWLPNRRTALAVLTDRGKVKILELTVTGSRLTSRLTTVDDADDTTAVRTLGLPDGRVILMTNKDITFYALARQP